MLVERKKLENELYKAIEEYAMDTKVIAQVEQDLVKHNIPHGETSAIFTKLIALETVNRNILYLLSKSLFMSTPMEILNPKKYFTKLEINEADQYKRDIKKDLIKNVCFEDVKQTAVDQFITVLSVQEISKLYGAGRIYYNPLTQRGMKVIKSGDTIIPKIDIRDSVVNEISKKMLDGSYIANAITFNILKNGDEDVQYNEKTRRIYAGENAEIDVVDGFHRSYAIRKALIVNPDLDLNMEVRIVYWDVEKARRFIYQEDLRTPIRRDVKTSLNDADLFNLVIKELNEKTRNEMQFKIATDLNLIEYNKAYVLHTTLLNATKMNFEIKSQRDVSKISDYLIEFFNELIGIYKNEFDNLSDSRKNNFITYSNMFIGYIALAAQLKDDPQWRTSLESILRNIDFSLFNSLWDEKELDIKNHRLNKRTFNAITKYFINLIKEKKVV